MIKEEWEIGYIPREIIAFLRSLGKPFFIFRDLQEMFGGNGSVALWILHDLTLLGMLRVAREWVYENRIPFLTYCFVSDQKSDPDLTETRFATFVMWY